MSHVCHMCDQVVGARSHVLPSSGRHLSVVRAQCDYLGV